ncbi:hypothetical protein [Hymenobacter lucidus]|uniref:Outer membrane protein beta-barrel domain-containing protein n=1 Tax=Hymenobacter lucidus TaxID=2880930 RepID=A0ABS8AXB5_9BACT|nr:hypothetical protein [Hymenobacter lucidus]MCB2410452.1 hypothetical protein [Hymenobacter lucidus]
MKKFIWAAMLLSGSTLAAHAQTIAAGTVSLGGSVGYSSNKNTFNTTFNNVNYSGEQKSSTFHITPSVGYFFADNIAAGLQLGYSAYSTRTTQTPNNGPVPPELDPTTNFSAGAYVQYYKMITEQFGVVGTLNGGYQNEKDYDYINNSTQISERKGSGLYTSLTPSIVFFPIPKLGLSASVGGLGYSRMSYDYPTNSGTVPAGYENKTSSLGASFGLDQLQFGGTFYFGR